MHNASIQIGREKFSGIDSPPNGLVAYVSGARRAKLFIASRSVSVTRIDRLLQMMLSDKSLVPQQYDRASYTGLSLRRTCCMSQTGTGPLGVIIRSRI